MLPTGSGYVTFHPMNTGPGPTIRCLGLIKPSGLLSCPELSSLALPSPHESFSSPETGGFGPALTKQLPLSCRYSYVQLKGR